MDEIGSSDTDLLASALRDAMDAYRQGLIISAFADALAMRRAFRRAWRRDTARTLCTVSGGAA